MERADELKMIAKFVGLTQGRENEQRWQNDWFDNDVVIGGLRYEELLFDCSWEWIMPTVKLISERIRGGITYDLRDALLRADKEEVYKEIVSIVEWYNKAHKG